MQKVDQKRSWVRVLLSVPLRLKITIPYLIVASLLAGLAIFQVSRSFITTLEERFEGQLQDASFRVADGISQVEEGHLNAARTIAFTMGVPEATADRNIAEIKNLVFPLVANNELYYTQILDSDGNLLASWHRTGDELSYIEGQETDISGWASVGKVLSGYSDEMGDKFSEIVETSWGLTVYTVGPILIDDELAGVLLVGSPLSVLVPELAISSLSNVTIYSADGFRAKSTFANDEPIPVLSERIMTQLSSASGVAPTRNLESGSREYVEAIDIVYLRSEPSGWFYGVALPKSLVRDAGLPELLPLIAIFIFGVIALIVLGISVAQLIAIPIFRLLDASEQVGGGDFDTQVDIHTDDEIGQLTNGFNRMVRELHQHEFVREMFGRMVSQDVSEAVLNGELALGGETRYVSVLFTDVRGFTSLSERFSPNDVITLLNQFFAIISKATNKHHGVINHFGGDSVLAVFGAPIVRSPVEALRQAIFTALEIRWGIAELNVGRISNGEAPLRYGVGINSGSVIAGNIGTQDRFHYTVIGDVVNVAARLQGISRQFPRTPLLIPEPAVRSVDPDSNLFDIQHLGEFRLKGKEYPVSTFAIVGSRSNILRDFTAFDEIPYPRSEALLACYLYCKGYSVSAIAETLQLANLTVARCIEIAAENLDEVGSVLVNEKGLPEDLLYRLRSDAV